MPTYVFVGRNQLNQQVRGERTAASREQLESLLRREQVTLLSVQEKKPGHCPSQTGRWKRQLEGAGHLHTSVFRDD